MRLIAASVPLDSPLVVALIAVLALAELGLLAWALSVACLAAAVWRFSRREI